ncbi:MAG: CHAT domain-containing protein [Bacteroidia bacterium]|nr:CHAT domain-containing protein [Bacteroidia bacterium]
MNLPVIFLAFANDKSDETRFLRNLIHEKENILRQLTSASAAGLCEPVVVEDASIEDILNVFQNPSYRNRIAVFHFAGHAGAFHLCMQAADGKVELAHAGGLAAFLGMQQNLQLVFLNGCSTQKQTDELLQARVGAVITTSQAIDDGVATDFSQRFYQSLGTGDSIFTSFQEAVAAARLKKGNDFRSFVIEESEAVPERFPWDFYVRQGAEYIRDWNLPDAAGNPLFALPALPEKELPEVPFRYLEWFREEDAEIFFGRAYQIRELYDRVKNKNTPPVIHLHGKSGVGKSSLLAAGLLPRLAAEYQVEYIRRDESLGLLRSLENGLKTAENQAEKAWRDREEKNKKPLLVVLDQVEEIFTRPLGDPEEELATLTGFINRFFYGKNPPAGKLILSYRKEFLAEIEEHFRQIRLAYSRVFLDKLRRNDIREAVLGLTRSPRTQKAYGLTIAPAKAGMAALPELIADDLLEDPESPVAPVLQILLSNMWKVANQNPPPVFSHELYQQMKQEGLWMDDFLNNRLKVVRENNPSDFRSGLALDLLAFHTTNMGTATARTAEEIFAEYPEQKTAVETLLAQLKEQYLLIDPEKENRSTRLAHDTLAPIVTRYFSASTAPGQQAIRVLQNRISLNSDPRQIQALRQEDLDLIEEGKPGMRRFSNDEKHLVLASLALYPGKSSPTQRFRFACEAYSLKENYLSRQAMITAWHSGVFSRKWKEGNKNFATCSPEGESLLIIDNDGKAGIFDLKGQPLHLFPPTTGMTEGKFSPDGKYILCVDRMEKISLWKTDGTLLAEIQTQDNTENSRYQRAKVATKMRAIGAGEGNLLDVDFDRNNNRIWVITREEGIRSFELNGKENGKAVKKFDDVYLAQVLPPVEKALILLESGELLLTDLSKDTYDKIGEVEEKVTALVMSPDYMQAALIAGIQVFRVDINQRQLIRRDFTQKVTDWAFSPDNRTVMVAFADGRGIVTDEMGQEVYKLFDDSEQIGNLLFFPGGKEMLVVADGEIYTYIPAINHTDFSQEYRYPITQLSWHPSGKQFLLVQGELAHVISMEDSRENFDYRSESGWIGAAAFLPEEESLIVGKSDGSIGILSYRKNISPVEIKGLDTGTLRMKLEEKLYANSGLPTQKANLVEMLTKDVAGHIGEVTALAVSPDGKTFVSGAEDGSMKIRNRRGDILRKIRGFAQNREIHNLLNAGPELFVQQQQQSFSPPADIFQDLRKGRSEEDFRSGHTGPVRSLAFSPGGEAILSASTDGTVRIWDISGKQTLMLEIAQTAVHAAQFADTGKKIVAGDDDGVLSCRTLEGVIVFQIQAHRGSVNRIALSSDEKLILTAGSDGKVVIWSLQGEKYLELNGHSSSVQAAVFSPDGKYVLTGSADKTVKLWLIHIGEMMNVFFAVDI